MKTTKLILYTLLSAALFTGCVKQEEAVNIQALNQQFIGAWNSKNSDQIISFLAEDVHFLQGETHFRGKSEVAEKWVRATLPSLNDLKTNVVSSATDNQTAYEAGTFSVDVLPETGQQTRGYGEGNFILLWKKGTDNAWKLSYAQLEDLPVQIKQ
ncbi:nuclear transport factor 2 family protein [Spirosoma sp. BT702]|uniref:Nuclear transport factor 2 family protein n=1 Tax=Spirosoma profusum TaxID=2771354 RepID=A0A926XX13_9BACT|nr:nuclear transport factor 2 family protein [Spirosoma profusum]MBD2702174.1 nuclear transport factor 2 family protein [Spirosoma profusum]